MTDQPQPTTPVDKSNVSAGAREKQSVLLSAIGRRYARCSFDSFIATNDKQRAAVATVRAFADDLPSRVSRGENLILFGPPGTGKDHLLVSVMLSGIARGLRFIGPATPAESPRPSTLTWSTGPRLAEQFRCAMKQEVSIGALLHSSVLAISDPVLDGELSDFQAKELYRVLDHRYRHQLPTWVSCNMANPTEFEQRLTRQVADRLRHDATAVFCDWPSHRKVRKP